MHQTLMLSSTAPAVTCSTVAAHALLRLLCSAGLLSPCMPSSRVADWFAQLNNKMGGDLKKIQTIGRYMVEVSRGGRAAAALGAVG